MACDLGTFDDDDDDIIICRLQAHVSHDVVILQVQSMIVHVLHCVVALSLLTLQLPG